MPIESRLHQPGSGTRASFRFICRGVRVLLFAASLTAIAAPVSAAVAYGLTTDNQLVVFDTGVPGTLLADRAHHRPPARRSHPGDRRATGNRTALRARQHEPSLRHQPGFRSRATSRDGDAGDWPARCELRFRLQPDRGPHPRRERRRAEPPPPSRHGRRCGRGYRSGASRQRRRVRLHQQFRRRDRDDSVRDRQRERSAGPAGRRERDPQSQRWRDHPHRLSRRRYLRRRGVRHHGQRRACICLPDGGRRLIALHDGSRDRRHHAGRPDRHGHRPAWSRDPVPRHHALRRDDDQSARPVP